MKLTYLYITDARPFTEGILDKCMWIALEKFTGLHEAEYFQDKDAVTRWAQDFLRLYCDIVICQMAKRGPSQLNPRGGGGLGDQRWMKGDLVGYYVTSLTPGLLTSGSTRTIFDRYAVGYR